MSFTTSYKRALGLGAAHEGVHHWWLQRLTAIALVPLGLLFVFPFARALGGGHAAVVALYSDWWNAFVAALFVLVSSWHLALGLQVVVEDYSRGWTRVFLLVATRLGCFALGAAGVLAIATILFSA